jgi:hypothetical protein
MKIFKLFDKSCEGANLSRSIIDIASTLLTDEKPSIVVKVYIDKTTKRIFEIDKSKL